MGIGIAPVLLLFAPSDAGTSSAPLGEAIAGDERLSVEDSLTVSQLVQLLHHSLVQFTVNHIALGLESSLADQRIYLLVWNADPTTSDVLSVEADHIYATREETSLGLTLFGMP
jgi:hypothetical protein